MVEGGVTLGASGVVTGVVAMALVAKRGAF